MVWQVSENAKFNSHRGCVWLDGKLWNSAIHWHSSSKAVLLHDLFGEQGYNLHYLSILTLPLPTAKCQPSPHPSPTPPLRGQGRRESLDEVLEPITQFLSLESFNLKSSERLRFWPFELEPSLTSLYVVFFLCDLMASFDYKSGSFVLFFQFFWHANYGNCYLNLSTSKIINELNSGSWTLFSLYSSQLLIFAIFMIEKNLRNN